MFADFVDRHDVRMVEIGRRLCFRLEALHVARRCELPGQDHLDRDDSIQADLAGAVYHAHSAASEHLDQFVVAEIAKQDP